MVVHVIIFSRKGGTQIRMDNLDDYILSVQNYKNGNYEFEIITSPDDVKKAIESEILEEVKKAVESGKKFVCIEEGSAGFFVLGAFSISVWILYELLTELFSGMLSFPIKSLPGPLLLSVAMFIVFVSLGLYFIGLEILLLRKPFIVLGAEGIVYKLRTGDIKGFNWEDVSMDFFELLDKYGHYKISIRILLPGSVIKLGHEGRFYTSKQFPNKKLNGIDFASHYLFLIFITYYNYGKYGEFEPPIRVFNEDVKLMKIDNSLEEFKETSYNSKNGKVEPPKISYKEDGKILKKKNYLDELKEVYKNYKKNYTFGKYETGKQIQDEFSNGKIFVLKGGNMLIWGCSIIMSILSVWLFILIVFGIVGFIQGSIRSDFKVLFTFVFIIIGILTFGPTIWLFLMNRMFLVIGPSGVYYRKIIKTGAFQWCNATVTEGRIGRIKTPKSPPVKIAQVTISLPNQANVWFTSMGYRNKEFAREVKLYMFIGLFQIYSELGKYSFDHN